MSILEMAKADIEQITGNADEFARPATFVAPEGDTAAVNVLHTKHHLAIDSEGRPMNSKNAHVSVAEKLLTDLNYPVRVNGEVKLKDHLVKVADSTGVIVTYIIKESFPNETIGLITCILGSWKPLSNTADSNLWTADTENVTADSE